MTCDKQFADRLISGGGRLPEEQEDAPDNPFVDRIVEYTNAHGQLAYGCTFQGENQNRYLEPSEYVRSPRIYWERKLSNEEREELRLLRAFKEAIIELFIPHRMVDPTNTLGMDVNDPRTIVKIVEGLRERVRVLSKGV